MKFRSLALAAAIAAAGTTAALTSAPAFAQAKEQFFPVLVYRTGAYAPNGVPFANGYVDYLKYVNAKGGINGVVNCAAIGIYGSIDDYPIEDWDRVLGVNLTAPFLLIQAAMPFLRRARAATIVNVASGAGLRPNAPGSLAYATSKGGLITMSKVLAYELAPAIRVNTVTPGVGRKQPGRHRSDL